MKGKIISIVTVAAIALVFNGTNSFAGHHKYGHAKWMDKVDTDNNGMLDRTEFTQHIDKMFARMDKNGDALIDEQDTSESKMCKWHHKKIKKADSNGDGAVSRSEFQAFKEQRFQAKDSNNDGLISNEEMEAWKQAHRQEKMKEKFMRLDKNDDGVINEQEFLHRSEH